MIRNILILLLIFCFNLCFAAKLPESVQKQYRAEIEACAEKEYPKIIKSADIILDKIEEYIKANKTKNVSMGVENIEKAQNELDALNFYFYLKLIDITDKYIKIKKDIPLASQSLLLADFIYPYLIDNKVNREYIDKIEDYTYAKYKILNYYLYKYYGIKY